VFIPVSDYEVLRFNQLMNLEPFSIPRSGGVSFFTFHSAEPFSKPLSHAAPVYSGPSCANFIFLHSHSFLVRPRQPISHTTLFEIFLQTLPVPSRKHISWTPILLVDLFQVLFLSLAPISTAPLLCPERVQGFFHVHMECSLHFPLNRSEEKTRPAAPHLASLAFFLLAFLFIVSILP